MSQPSDISNARVVVMCGISGSGKTVFAQGLESKGYVRVSADGILWSEYGPKFATLPSEQQREAFMTIGKQISEQTAQFISAGEKVVVDSTMCKRFKRDEIRAVCRSMGIEPVIVYLKAPYNILRERLASREGTGPDDQTISDDQLRNFFNNFEAPDDSEDAIIIEQQ